MKKILIKNGTLVTPDKIYQADILISNQKIEKISEQIDSNETEIIDAKGKYIFPGFIDTHTHMGIPIRGTTSADDFESGSIAALHGGVTTIIDFTVQEKSESLMDSLKKRKAQADGKTSVDYALHCNVTDFDDSRAAEIPAIIQEGVISFKAFTAYREAGMQLDDRQILELLWQVKLAGGTVMFHAENGDMVDFLTAKYVKYNKTTPPYHALSRPAEAEIEAVTRILTLNKFIQCPVYFVHLTTYESVQIASMARQKKQPVYLETCPQYLIFDESIYSTEDGHYYIAAPAFRRKEDSEYLWMALQDNLIDTVGTDHCPFSRAQKDAGQREFHKTPNGLSGVETLFSILYNEGVKKDRITLQKLVSLISEEPARLFGLFPKKGILMEKSDADLVIFNPAGKGKITTKKLHSNVDWTPYEGMETEGKIESVMLRGNWLLKDGAQIESGLKQGRFIPAFVD
jgi:dihydropyrimidinase